MNNNYQASLNVTATPQACVKAATSDYAKWWTTPDQPMNEIGDRSKFTFPPGISYWTFELTKLEPAKRVEMRCVEALHIHEGQPKEIEQEWLGTDVIWTFTATGTGTRIDLEHRGLKPDLLCFDVCKAGWDFFLLDSLKAFLETGTGSPHRAP